MGTNIIVDKTYHFSKRIMKAYHFLRFDNKEFVISQQLLKSGTSIGANVKEAEFAQSQKDFLSKMNIALKEASETEYWIELLRDSDHYGDVWVSLLFDCVEIKKILHAIVKTTRNSIK